MNLTWFEGALAWKREQLGQYPGMKLAFETLERRIVQRPFRIPCGSRSYNGVVRDVYVESTKCTHFFPETVIGHRQLKAWYVNCDTTLAIIDFQYAN